ncbi:DoxX family protein, partial [Bacteroidota bacterium]
MNINKVVFIAFRFILGMSFLISGIGKSFDSKAFSILISEYGFGIYSFLGPILIVFEIALGLLIIAGYRQRKIAILSLNVLVFFTIVYTYAYLFKGVKNCGCLGSLEISTSPLFFYIKNLVLILFSWILLLNNNKILGLKSKYSTHIFYMILVILAFITGFSYKNPVFRKAIVAPKIFKGLNVDDSDLRGLVNVHKDSTYMLFLYSYKCNFCIN